MKSILYVGATLMIGASIYGFVDYKQNSQEKQFGDLYTEKKAADPRPVVQEEAAVPVEKKEIVNAKPVAVKRQIAKKAVPVPVVHAVKPISEEEKMVPGEKKEIEKTAVAVTPAKENNITKKVNKKKKISTKLFSRAPIREDYPEEKILLKEPKKEPVKTENKE